jgi:hypothetical protein
MEGLLKSFTTEGTEDTEEVYGTSLHGLSVLLGDDIYMRLHQ